MPPGDGNWTFEEFAHAGQGPDRERQAAGPPSTASCCRSGNTTTNEGMVGFLRAFGGDLFDADGKKSPAQHARVDRRPQGDGRALQVRRGACRGRPTSRLSSTGACSRARRVGIVIQTAFAAAAWPGQIAKLPEPFEMEVVPNPIGPTGKHAIQVSSDGKGVAAATKNPAQAWTVLSRLFTGQRHGIERFANGLGSPGSRNDVWDSDEFREKAPKLGNIAKTWCCRRRPPMAAWHHPANGRFAEHEPILLNEFVKVTLGQLDRREVRRAGLGKQIQEILDKPPV